MSPILISVENNNFPQPNSAPSQSPSLESALEALRKGRTPSAPAAMPAPMKRQTNKGTAAFAQPVNEAPEGFPSQFRLAQPAKAPEADYSDEGV